MATRAITTWIILFVGIHNTEFVRAVIIHTNFAESYHSLRKRGLIGAFHHVSVKHFHSYVNEFFYR